MYTNITIYQNKEEAKKEFILNGFTLDVTRHYEGSCRCKCGESETITFMNPETKETQTIGLCAGCGEDNN